VEQVLQLPLGVLADWLVRIEEAAAAVDAASLCISTTVGTVPQIFGAVADDHVSAHSPMGDAGVMGKIAMTSFKR
jgi:hypothetical protein